MGNNKNNNGNDKFDYSIKCIDNILMIDIDCKYKEMIERIISELNDSRIKIARTQWQSKYNNYIIYDYEPFCNEGFKLAIDIDCSNETMARYASFVLTQRLEQFTKLEKLYTGV